MKSVISGLLVAFSMYSAIPVPQVNWEKQTMRWALGFLTGTAAECVPVTKLDAYQLGSGKIGPVTARILARFQELTQTTGTAF